MKRKFFAAFLSLCMVMSLVPMTALAAENKESANATAITTQEELQRALNTAASTKGTVTLTSNITVSDTGLSGYGSAAIVVPEGITLDGNGYAIKAETWTSEKQYHVVGVMNTTKDTTTFLLPLRWVNRSPPHPPQCAHWGTYGLWWLRLDLTEQSPGLFDPRGEGFGGGCVPFRLQHPPLPARPAGGRAVTGIGLWAAGQAEKKRTPAGSSKPE